ncbi:hypothetical protein SCLCIDRAFT_652564 [Scleroderma citrinum Foug A]|uniref:Uncharacterized protein n=1 Tax=Scleroderma citrinum Foug A TaxID=1036808 RepID=A0A0C3D5J2_9AGAM|nr:hypothetical protein SCLCIDRAFT_652564 [Scleroderma citrinum Foug A]
MNSTIATKCHDSVISMSDLQERAKAVRRRSTCIPILGLNKYSSQPLSVYTSSSHSLRFIVITNHCAGRFMRHGRNAL